MAEQAHILIVDDEADILELIRYNLARAGHRVTGVQSGAAALAVARADHPDLVVLDWMLPDMDGIAICKQLRDDATLADVPIMMVTAKGADPDVITGLTAGADDYVSKPFTPQVLVARAAALLRRRGNGAAGTEEDEPVLRLERITIDPGRHRVTVDEREVHLTPSEFRILQMLAGRPGWVFSRTHIMDRIKGDGTVVTERSIDVQVAGLRKKLGDAGKLVETVRGMGYRFKG